MVAQLARVASLGALGGAVGILALVYARAKPARDDAAPTKRAPRAAPVSYTHLTLPTKRIV